MRTTPFADTNFHVGNASSVDPFRERYLSTNFKTYDSEKQEETGTRKREKIGDEGMEDGKKREKERIEMGKEIEKRKKVKEKEDWGGVRLNTLVTSAKKLEKVLWMICFDKMKKFVEIQHR